MVGSIIRHKSVDDTIISQILRFLSLCVCPAGEDLGCLPLLDVLDLSWNAGVGGGALQSLLGKLNPALRELHLVSCQLTAADAPVLGTKTER